MNPEAPTHSDVQGSENPDRTAEHRWADILVRLKQKIIEDNLPVVSAGIAFYGLLALFPAMAVLVSSYGLFADPSDITAHVRAFPGLPDAVKQVLTKHLQELASSSPAALSLGFIGALLFSIWSASRATKALLIAMRIAYDEADAHGFVRRNVIELLVTAAGLIAITFGLLLITILPAGLRNLALPALQTVDTTKRTEPWARSWYFFFGSGSRLSWSCWEPSSTPRSSVGVWRTQMQQHSLRR